MDEQMTNFMLTVSYYFEFQSFNWHFWVYEHVTMVHLHASRGSSNNNNLQVLSILNVHVGLVSLCESQPRFKQLFLLLWIELGFVQKYFYFILLYFFSPCCWTRLLYWIPIPRARCMLLPLSQVHTKINNGGGKKEMTLINKHLQSK